MIFISVSNNKDDDDVILLEDNDNVEKERDPLEVKVTKVKVSPIVISPVNNKPTVSTTSSKTFRPILPKLPVVGVQQKIPTQVLKQFTTTQPIKEITLPTVISSQIAKSSCYSLMIDESKNFTSGTKILVMFIRLVYSNGQSEERFVQPFNTPMSALVLVQKIYHWMLNVKLDHDKLAYVTVSRNWPQWDEFMYHWKSKPEMPNVEWHFCTAAEALRCIIPTEMEPTVEVIDQVISYLVKNKLSQSQMFTDIVVPIRQGLPNEEQGDLIIGEVCWYKLV